MGVPRRDPPSGDDDTDVEVHDVRGVVVPGPNFRPASLGCTPNVTTLPSGSLLDTCVGTFPERAGHRLGTTAAQGWATAMSGEFTARVRRNGRGERSRAETFQVSVTVLDADGASIVIHSSDVA